LRKDFWWKGIVETHHFNDLKFFNSDQFDQDKNATELGAIYLRMDTEQTVQTRTCFSFQDFIGTIGGIKDILINIVAFFYGKYAS
jgi:hypothetical protein